MAKKILDSSLRGSHFGTLLVIRKPRRSSKSDPILWECLCDPQVGGCGKKVLINVKAFYIGNRKSCGCLKKNRANESLKKRMRKAKRKGLCVQCGKKRKSYAWLCDSCQAKRRERYVDNYAANKTVYISRVKLRWKRNVSQGLCGKCGKPRNKYATICDECARKRRQYERKRREPEQELRRLSKVAQSIEKTKKQINDLKEKLSTLGEEFDTLVSK